MYITLESVPGTNLYWKIRVKGGYSQLPGTHGLCVKDPIHSDMSHLIPYFQMFKFVRVSSFVGKYMYFYNMYKVNKFEIV